jgi:uncharacterized lipoprotein YddW (UPF0748 family)
VIRPVLLALLFVALAPAAVQYVPSNVVPPEPEREFRGAWVASVNNIDWPSRPGLPTGQQQQELLRILDRCQQLKLNAVIFQVRPACDALYSSAYEPWSEYLTGTQGKAPSPFWDPLAFAVTQAHARGLELHAWLNPFRARYSGERSSPAANHIRNSQPGVVKAYGKFLWLDPGFPATHEHSIRVILDVVQRYDVDGIHIDDYFYPYPEKDSGKKDMPFPDTSSWQNYQRSGGKLARDDWRRDNVNRFLARMYRDLKAVKPWVKVGISPFGIYRPGFPAQIKGFDQFESLYADPRAWLASGTLDYLAPQLYWPIDQPPQSFPVLLKWWAENNPHRKMIVAGVNTAAVGTRGKENGWSAYEIERQIQLTRKQPGVSGHIHWNMSALMKNKGGVDNALMRGEYGQLATVPALRTTRTISPPPALIARVTRKGAEFKCGPNPAVDARFFLVQVRGENGLWQSRIQPANAFTLEQNPPPAAVSVRAIDKFGNFSDPMVLTRVSK